METGLRERKKRATRKSISDIATKLFTARGFDAVTIDDVALAANVSKMTVFNYFARKEDLFFDETDSIQPLIRDALAARGRRSPLVAMHALAHEMLEADHDLARVSPRIVGFWRAVANSPALRARAREINEELERDLARMLAEAVGTSIDAGSRLIAALLLAAWRVAFREGLRRPRTSKQVIRELFDRGFAAAKIAARDTAYV